MDSLFSATDLGIWCFKLDVSLAYFTNFFLRSSGTYASLRIFSSQSFLHMTFPNIWQGGVIPNGKYIEVT